MTTLVQEIKLAIAELEKTSGPDGIYVNMLRKQLADIEKQKEPTEEKWSVQAIKNKD
jgi:hypothetical protein